MSPENPCLGMVGCMRRHLKRLQQERKPSHRFATHRCTLSLILYRHALNPHSCQKANDRVAWARPEPAAESCLFRQAPLLGEAIHASGFFRTSECKLSGILVACFISLLSCHRRALSQLPDLFDRSTPRLRRLCTEPSFALSSCSGK